ncbi:recombinase family protein [Frankia sp. R82]|uniref:recombinase family protein n=1 Tax=Frankia sp. R82 TaxID=2950553 RepID=UPI002044B519|nr:recombinase family protein [Frankia sp. R82]MCM3885556.1 recombinase family protein [Frankia sp. R82]
MIRFAFYGRVSTEDQQDPEASRNWQLARARALIEGHGQITTEYFDVGKSRSLPWKRRPQAALLLQALPDADRGFEAVVIGEPHRAFYGNQFGLTMPVLDHYKVDLWVPEVGGCIDPTSEAHDMIMSVFGGMSKAERNRIKVRVRSAMKSQAKVEGRFLGGRPPYGYRLADAGPHPNPAKAADGKRLHVLEKDPVTAPVVERIFRLYLNGMGIFLIAQTLTGEGILSPSGHDRPRNSHREGIGWSKSAVRAILDNPRYTGRQVWNKQRKEEVLLDVDDVALGHETKLAWNQRDQWVWSDRPAHPAIISEATFLSAQQRIKHRGPAAERIGSPDTRHPYALRSLLFHEQCGRRMQGNWNHGHAHYRCRYPQEYALANHIDHPLTVYVREDSVVPALDDWLASAFDPDRVEATLAALEQAQPDDTPAADPLRQAVAACDRKLTRHRAALEAGADPVIVTGWIAEVQAERAAAIAALERQGRRTPARPRLTRPQIKSLIDGLGGLLKVLREADPADKAEIYRELGLKLTYDHETEMITAEAAPRSSVCVVSVSEGGVEPLPHHRSPSPMSSFSQVTWEPSERRVCLFTGEPADRAARPRTYGTSFGHGVFVHGASPRSRRYSAGSADSCCADCLAQRRSTLPVGVRVSVSTMWISLGTL